MMNLFPFDGVIFDVDGTLFDTEHLMHQVWQEVGAEMGWPQPGAEYLDYVGNGRNSMFEKMLTRYGPTFPKEEFMQRCSQRLQDRIERDGVPLKPGVQALFDFLREQQVPMGVATSTASVRALRRLSMCGLDSYLSAVITGDQVTHGKPDPEIYLLACQALGTEPRRTLAVEDSRNGILSATAAGMPTAMIPDMIPPTQELDVLLWRRFASLSELQTALEESIS